MAVMVEKGILRPETFRFQWKIERFFDDCQKPGDYYRSPKFPIAYANAITKWSLQVYPKGEKEENKDKVALYLNFTGDHDVTVDYEITILNEPSMQNKGKVTDTFKSPTQGWGWCKFREHNSLKDATNGALIDDTLTILCEITFHQLIQDDIKSFNGYSKYIDKIGNGFGDYEKLLENGNFSDVTFNVQDKKINLHKNILSCRSSVFEAMFNHDMKERNQNEVDITDIDYDVMKELFRFIYSGKVKNIKKIAGDLLIAADKYSMKELKALCEKTLCDKLTVDNAIEYLKLADMYDTIQLKKLIIKFVAAHYKEVAKKPGFANLGSDMMHQIILAIAEKN